MPFTASGLIFSIWLLKFCYLSSLILLRVLPTYRSSYIFQKEYWNQSISMGIRISVLAPIFLLALALFKSTFLHRSVDPMLLFLYQIDKGQAKCIQPKGVCLYPASSVVNKFSPEAWDYCLSEVQGPINIFWGFKYIKINERCQNMWFF